MEALKNLRNRMEIGRYIRNAVILWGPICFLGVVLPELPSDSLATLPLLDSVLALWLALATLLLAAAVGTGILNIIRVEISSPVEQALFAIPLGLGAISITIFLLGLMGILIPLVILLIMFGLSILVGGSIDHLIHEAPRVGQSMGKRWHDSAIPIRLVIIAGFLLATLSLLQALAPPTGVDGLYYHLPIPKLYLEAGRIFPTPDVTPSGFPLIGEMLFTVGMAFGSDIYSQLMNLAFAVLFVAATITAGQRWAQPYAGWIAGAILLGMPIVAIWATLPYVDFAWALYEFLGIYALLIWGERKTVSTAILAGLMFGLALGTKYLALGGLLFTAIAVITLWRREHVLSLAKLVIPFFAAAVLVGAPWYIRNWIWYSNPVYPFFNGLFNPASASLGLPYLAGLSLDPLYQLLLPFNLYFRREQFAGVYGTIEFLNPLFLLIFAYPWMRKGRTLDRLAFLTFMRYIFWSLTHISFMRYLLPIFPSVSILAAYVVQTLYQRARFRIPIRALLAGIGGGMVASSLVYSIIFFVDVNPLGAILGWETRHSFLTRRLEDYAAIQYVNNELSHDDTVLMIIDARGYYCNERCIPDYFHTRWLNMLISSPTPVAVASALQLKGITHLLFSNQDANYMLSIDETGIYYDAVEFLLEDFLPQCAEALYDDGSASVYKITCPGK